MKAQVDIGGPRGRAAKRLKELCDLRDEIDVRLSMQSHPDRHVPQFAAAEFARRTELAQLAKIDYRAPRSSGAFALMDEIVETLARDLFESLEPAAMYGIKIAAAHFVRDALAYVSGGRQRTPRAQE
jgi:hypothetical protein